MSTLSKNLKRIQQRKVIKLFWSLKRNSNGKKDVEIDFDDLYFKILKIKKRWWWSWEKQYNFEALEIHSSSTGNSYQNEQNIWRVTNPKYIPKVWWSSYIRTETTDVNPKSIRFPSLITRRCMDHIKTFRDPKNNSGLLIRHKHNTWNILPIPFRNYLIMQNNSQC